VDKPRTVELPAQQYQVLQQQASKLGLRVRVYIAMLIRDRECGPAKDFMDALAYLNRHYPNTLKKLAQ